MDFLEKLREYFNQNTDEQIKKDWEKSKDFDNIKPTSEDFLDLHLKTVHLCRNGSKELVSMVNVCRSLAGNG